MRPQLHVVNADTGEIQEPPCSHIATCEHCSEREDAFDVMARKLTGALAEIGRLKRDADAEAREHELWAQAEAAHTWYRLASGHFAARFDTKDFESVLPRLREPDGLSRVLKAICALAYDPHTTVMRNGKTKRHDGWHLIGDSRAKCDERGEHVPKPDEPHFWKRWLIQRIEGNLR